MNPDPERLEKMLARIRAVHAEYSARAEQLRAQGMEVGGFLEDCEGFIAALEGRGDGDYDVRGFIARLDAFVQEASEYAHIQTQAEVVQVEGMLYEFVEKLERDAAKFREHGGKMEADSAAQLEASAVRMREELAAGKLPEDALDDALLTITSQRAELKRRQRMRTAACMLYWEQWPPERWAKLSPEERLKLEGVLEVWRREKETVLGELPLEDRRRLEAMSYEDFDKPATSIP